MASVRNSSKSPVSRFVIAFFILFFTLPFFGSFFQSFSNSDSSVEVADGFTIDSYKVIMNVAEDNKIDVTEEIIVNWYEQGHHGIYKFTPQWYEYTPSDGKTIKRKSILSNYKAIGEGYTTDFVKKKPRIKIGDANTTLPLGPHTYIINYTYDMGQDPYKETDEFIFHAFGDYWGTRIKNASLEIHMPNNFDSNSISFWEDKYRESDISSKVDYYVSNNTLYANIFSDYNLTKSLTVDILLPNGYFVGGTSNYGYTSLLICFLIILIAIFSFFRWFKYGKDHSKVARPVEFYPPEDYDAAQIGYIYGKQTSKKLTISLIIQLASKGYIKIDMSNDKKTITITNLYPKTILSDIKEVTVPIRTIKISKLKESDPKTTDSEKKWMEFLFREGNKKDVISGFDTFFEKTQNLINNNYIKIDSDTIEDHNVLGDVSKLQSEIDKSRLLLPKLSETETIVYDSLFRNGDTNELNSDDSFYLTFSKVSESLERDLKDKIHDKKATVQMTKTIVLLVLGIIGFYYSWSVVEDMNPTYNFVYTIAFISLFGSALFSFIMGRKTEYGETITARVLGFRNYIDKAEKEQLEKLVESNPTYFYNILPYAYSMNISQKWVKHFENIPLPKVDMGNFDYYDIIAFRSISDSVNYPALSSGSSSGGGGCSSCGGGCSSCGGGGSW